VGVAGCREMQRAQATVYSVALFHVRLSIAGQRSDEVKIDLTEEQLQRQILQPYQAGDLITVNGRGVSMPDLERVRISSSEGSARDFIPRLEAEDRASSVAVLGGPSYSWRAAARAQDVTDEYIKGPPGHGSDSGADAKNRVDATDASARRNRITVPAGPGDGRSVFLVHGRNDAMATAMRTFLRTLDLRIIEWEQAVALTGEPNPYIGDVMAAGLEQADAVVVLATPDDLVRLAPALANGPTDPELAEAGQPRQNVIYEAGMAMALAPTRTLIVATPATKILSDIAGRHLAYLDNSPRARKRIVGRLQNTGLAVNDTGEDWLTAGDFGS